MSEVKLMLAIARKKDNGKMQTGKDEKCIKRVFYETPSHRERTKKELTAIINVHPEYVWRLQETLNFRDTKKAYIVMQRKMLGWMENYDSYSWTEKITGLWESSLMKPDSISSGDRQVLLDLDEKSKTDEFREFLKINVIEVVEEYPTPNGHHFIVKSFDKRMLDDTGFKGKVDILRDGLKVVQ